MGIQFFGEFLLERSVITREQLLEALELQDKKNLKFGAVAVQKKYLTEDQVKQINDRQTSQDMRFGELAVSMDLLTAKQSQEILTIQKNNYLYLGEALCRLGYIKSEVMKMELSIFQKEQSRYALEDVAIPSGVLGAEVIKVSVDLTRKMFVRMMDTIIKVGIGRKADASDSLPTETYEVSVALTFEGSPSVTYVLSVSKPLAILIASRQLGSDASVEAKPIIDDVVQEFCNVVCGNAAAKLAQMGISTEISPPSVLAAVPLPSPGAAVVVFPVHAAEGAIDLRFVCPA
jgi:CheY-specific phosphatase CheX